MKNLARDLKQEKRAFVASAQNKADEEKELKRQLIDLTKEHEHVNTGKK